MSVRLRKEHPDSIDSRARRHKTVAFFGYGKKFDSFPRNALGRYLDDENEVYLYALVINLVKIHKEDLLELIRAKANDILPHNVQNATDLLTPEWQARSKWHECMGKREHGFDGVMKKLTELRGEANEKATTSYKTLSRALAAVNTEKPPTDKKADKFDSADQKKRSLAHEQKIVEYIHRAARDYMSDVRHIHEDATDDTHKSLDRVMRAHYTAQSEQN